MIWKSSSLSLVSIVQNETSLHADSCKSTCCYCYIVENPVCIIIPLNLRPVVVDSGFLVVLVAVLLVSGSADDYIVIICILRFFFAIAHLRNDESLMKKDERRKRESKTSTTGKEWKSRCMRLCFFFCFFFLYFFVFLVFSSLTGSAILPEKNCRLFVFALYVCMRARSSLLSLLPLRIVVILFCVSFWLSMTHYRQLSFWTLIYRNA